MNEILVRGGNRRHNKFSVIFEIWVVGLKQMFLIIIKSCTLLTRNCSLTINKDLFVIRPNILSPLNNLMLLLLRFRECGC